MDNQTTAEQTPRTNVSSTFTLFFKYFVPTIWIVFFGTLWLIVLFSKDLVVGNLPPMTFKIIFSLFILGGIGLFYLTVMRLKRVEMDEEFIYATNYLKVFKYPYFNIEKIQIKDFGIFKVGHIFFKEPGSFGKKIVYMLSKERFNKFIEEHPTAKSLIEGLPADTEDSTEA